MYGFNGMGFGMGFGWIIIIVVIVAAIWFITSMAKTNRNKTVNKTAFDILKERYARGEISKAEFDRMKNDIL